MLERQYKHRNSAVQTVKIIGTSFAVDVLALLLYASIDKISFTLVAYFAAAGLMFCVTLFGLIASGRAEAGGDPAATRFQLIAIVMIHLAGLLIAPQIGIFFILSLFLVFSFAALTMTVAQAVTALIGICTAVTICLLGFELQPMIPSVTLAERVVTSLVFTLTLTRMVLLSAYSSRQRKLLRDKNVKLAESLAKVEKMAITDDLTGVFNRGWMVTALTHECQSAHRHGGTFTVAMLDIDHFKQVNDRFGHLSGDQVLKLFAQLVKGELRKTDQLARVGGEEFLVLLPETPHHGGLLVLERIRRKVAEHTWACLLYTSDAADDM
jgi:diguanylate cyclase (GGDEF)-like protein